MIEEKVGCRQCKHFRIKEYKTKPRKLYCNYKKKFIKDFDGIIPVFGENPIFMKECEEQEEIK